MNGEFSSAHKTLISVLRIKGNQRAFLIFCVVWVVVTGIYVLNLYSSEVCAPVTNLDGSHINYSCGVTGYIGYEQEQQTKLLSRLALIFVGPIGVPIGVGALIYGLACVKSLVQWVLSGYSSN